jgi:hypothetical protein
MQTHRTGDTMQTYIYADSRSMIVGSVTYTEGTPIEDAEHLAILLRTATRTIHVYTEQTAEQEPAAAAEQEPAAAAEQEPAPKRSRR